MPDATYGWELLNQWLPEGLPVFERHHAECEPLAALYPADPDFDALFALEGDGRLKCFVARVGGAFAGCNALLLAPTLWRKSVLTADGLIFLVAPEWREQWIGYKLIKKPEPDLKAWRVQTVRYTPVSIYDVSPLLRRAQYQNKGCIWEKVL